MSANDSLLFVAALVGGLSAFFILAAFIADIVWPWINRLWWDRCSRPQATYRRPR
jgi:hypothetical protein